MASKLKVDQLTTTSESGTLEIVGDVAIDASSSTSALTLPTGTTAQRPASPAAGMIRYNTESGYLEFYDGTDWFEVGAAKAPAGTSADPFLFPNQLLLDTSITADEGTAYFKTGSATTRNLRWIRMTHGGTPRVWVIVCVRNKNASDLFTNSGVSEGSSDSSNHFKLADSEVEYLTNQTNNAERYGLAYFPAISNTSAVSMTKSLFNNADANIWRHVDWGSTSGGIPIGYSTTNASSLTPSMRASATTDFSGALPTSFNGQSDSNSYCSGTQILSNWDDTGEDLWSARFNSAGGCAYCGENSGTYSDPNGVGGGGNYAGWVHVLMVS